MSLETNLQQVHSQIAAAATRASRDPTAVKLVVVTKTRTAELIQQIVDAGNLDLGENRVQELLEKYPLLQGPVRWHLIGSLQTNKVKAIIDKVYLIHSLDRWSLAEEINHRAQQLGMQCQVLVQVNISGEASKQGLPAEQAPDFLQKAAQLPGLRICGLMTMAPFETAAEATRPVFRKLRALAQQLDALQLPGVTMEYLSMGMSNDYQVAIEEGATIVRIGSEIFGPRG